MGGDREFLSEPAAPSKGDTREQRVGNLRIHENKGEVHFHDDKTHLKCAIPVATYFRAFDEARHTGFSKPIEFIDHDNKTQVRIERDPSKPDEVEISATVSPVNVGANLSKFLAFMGS